MPFKKLQIKILGGQFKKLIDLIGIKSARIYSWYIEDLNNTTNHNDIIDMYKILHPTTARYTFSQTHGTLSKTDQILGNKPEQL